MNYKLILIPILLVLLVGVVSATDDSVETSIDNFTSSDVNPITTYNSWLVDGSKPANICELLSNEMKCAGDERVQRDYGFKQYFNITGISKSSGNSGYFCVNALEDKYYAGGYCFWLQAGVPRWQLLNNSGAGVNSSACNGAAVSTYYKWRFAFNNSNDGMLKFKNWAFGAAEPNTWCLTLDFNSIHPTTLNNGSYRFISVGGSGVADHYFDNISNWTAAAPPAPPTGTTLNISNTLPATNTQYGLTTINISGTGNSSSSTNFNATLWIGLNGVPLNNRTINYASGNGVYFNFSIDLTEGNWSYFVSLTNNNSQLNGTQNFFYTDIVDPSITWTTPAGSDTVVGDLTTSILIEDNNLYSYYLNISSGSQVIYNSSNLSLTGLTSYTITDTFPISNYSEVLTAWLKVCDGHTKNIIDIDARMDFVKSELTFDDIKIYQENKLLTKDINYEQFIDKYSFEFETTLSTSTAAFIVSSPSFIDILHGKSSYAGHLTTGDKWIDFETDDLDNIQIERINDKQVRVTVTKKKLTTDWVFNSIGELNCVIESKNFLAVNTTYNAPSNVLAGSANTFLLNVTYNSLYYNSVPTATLYYNGTGYSATGSGGFGVGTVDYQFSKSITSPLVDSDTEINWNWSYVVNSTTYWTTQQTLNISSPLIDNCSTYTNQFANFTLRDEVSGIHLTGLVEYIFEITNGAYSYNYNGSETNGNFTFCLSPAWSNFTTDVTMQYAVTGYGTRDYVADNFWVDNNTEEITLYSLTTGNSTEIIIHTVDENDYDLENVFIEAYRYDIATDSDLLVETEYTDSEGNAILDLQTGSVYYSFKFYQGGDLKLSTTRFKLFATTYDYIIKDDVTSRLGDWLQLKDEITRSLTYYNSTQLINFTWTTSSTLADFFCLNITFGNGTTAYGGCSNSLSNSLSYTITTLNQTYTAFGMVTTDTGYTFVLESLSVDTRTGWRTFGKGLGLTLAMLILMVCGLIGLFNKNVAVIMGCLSMIVIYMFGLIPMGFGSLMGILVIGVIALIILNRRSSL